MNHTPNTQKPSKHKTNEKQPQQTPNPTTRTKENNRETTEGSTNVKI